MKIVWQHYPEGELTSEAWITTLDKYQIRIYRVSAQRWEWVTNRTGKYGTPKKETSLDDARNHSIAEVRSWVISNKDE